MSLAGRTVRLISQLGGYCSKFYSAMSTLFAMLFELAPWALSNNTGIVPRLRSLYLANYAKLLSVSAKLPNNPPIYSSSLSLSSAESLA